MPKYKVNWNIHAGCACEDSKARLWNEGDIVSISVARADAILAESPGALTALAKPRGKARSVKEPKDRAVHTAADRAIG